MKLEDILTELKNIRDMKFAPALHISNKIHDLEAKIKKFLSFEDKQESQLIEQVKEKSTSQKKVIKETAPSPISNPRDIKIKVDNNVTEYTPNVSINNVSMDGKN